MSCGTSMVRCSSMCGRSCCCRGIFGQHGSPLLMHCRAQRERHRSGSAHGLSGPNFEVVLLIAASEDFLLAGGTALLALNLTTRPTQHLDFFTSSAGGTVRTARDAFEAATAERNWRVERIQDAKTFCRLLIYGDEDLLVDLALDSVPGMAPTASIVGPTFAPEELAGRKLVAQFDRAESRDFTDGYALRTRFDQVSLLTRAAEVDRGFDQLIFASMLDSLDQFLDSMIPVAAEEVPRLRPYFAEWASAPRR